MGSSKKSQRHNPYHPYVLHSPTHSRGYGENFDIFNTVNLKSLIRKSPVMPFLTQLAAIAERKLTCVHMTREAVRQIPIIEYVKDENEYDYGCKTICVICIESFESGDKVRKLPNCEHVFHRDCIDTWLLGLCSDMDTITSFCPTCRKDGELIVSEPLTPSQLIEIPAEVFISMGKLMEEKNYQAIQQDDVPCNSLDCSGYVLLSMDPSPLSFDSDPHDFVHLSESACFL